MVKFFLICLAICFANTGVARSLDNSQVYTIPSSEVWVITNIQRNYCKVCTSDIYVKSGMVKINDVWISGTFKFSLRVGTEVLFQSNTVFGLGDVVNNINVDIKN